MWPGGARADTCSYASNSYFSWHNFGGTWGGGDGNDYVRPRTRDTQGACQISVVYALTQAAEVSYRRAFSAHSPFTETQPCVVGPGPRHPTAGDGRGPVVQRAVPAARRGPAADPGVPIVGFPHRERPPAYTRPDRSGNPRRDRPPAPGVVTGRYTLVPRTRHPPTACGGGPRRS